jgi:PAS domain S-box-containing protein
MRRKNGACFPAEISVTRLRDGRCLGIVRDVTARKLAEEALRQSEEHLRSLVETALDTIFTLSAQATISSLNPAFEKFTGWSREEWIGKNFAPLVHPGDLPLAMQMYRQAMAGVTPPVFVLRFQTKHGAELVGEIIVTPQVVHGEVIGVLGVARDVTERLRADQALRESEAKFRTLTETVAAAAFIFQGSKLLYVNPAAEAITGYTRDELLQMQFWDVVDPNFEALIRERGMARQKGEAVVSQYEVKIRTKKGESRWAELTAGVIDFQGGPAILGTAFDITNRKRVEQALAERAGELARSEKALRSQSDILQSILNNMSEAVVVADRDGKFLIWNPAAEKTVGIGLTDTRSEHWSKRYGIFRSDKVTPFPWDKLPLVRAIRGEETDDVEMFVRNENLRGGLFLSVSGRPLRDERGAINGGLVVFRDVTERKRVVEELRRSEERSNAILNAVPDLMFRLSRHGKFLDFKANKPDELWVRPGEFVGKTVREIMPPKFVEQCMHFIDETLRTGAMQFFEYQLPIGGAMQDYEARLVVSGPDEVLSIVRNITEHKRLERQILEISDREQRRIGQDLHDGLCQHLIGTAFASKVLEQKLAEKSLKESADAREIADLIEQGISQARNLARGLYPVQLESGGLIPAIEQLAANVDKLFNIPCVCKCDPTIHITDRGVTTHLYRIAQEAINNGIKHGKAKQFVLGLSRNGKAVALTITDNGTGFPKTRKESKGMGLNIMRYRAQMIGATVEVRPAGKRGTVVTCTLPYLDSEEGKRRGHGDEKTT